MNGVKMFLCFSFFIFYFSLSYGQSWLWGVGGINSAMAYTYDTYPVSADSIGNVYFLGSGIIKYDPYGNFKWVQTGSGQSISSASVSAERNGTSVFIAGSYQDKATFGSYTIQTPYPNAAFIVKYDALGNVKWAKSAKPSSAASTSSTMNVCSDWNGNAYLLGQFSDTVSFGSNTLYSHSTSGNIFLVKYAPNGNVLWAKAPNLPSNSSFAGFYGESTYSLGVDNSGNAYVIGAFTDTISFGAYTLIGDLNSYFGNFFVKYDKNGNLLWAKQSDTAFFSISVDKYGGVYLVSQNTLYKYNTIGNLIWARNLSFLSHRGDGEIWSVSADNIGNVYISGAMDQACCFLHTDTMYFGNTPLIETGIEPTFIAAYDSSGNLLCDEALSCGGDDADAVSADGVGNAYMGGDFAGTPFIVGNDTLLLGRFAEVPFIAKWKCNAIKQGINEVKTSQTNIAVYPNPFNSTTTVLLNTEGRYTLELDDLTGRKLQNIEFTGSQYELSAQGLAKGIYFVRVFDNQNSLIGTTKIIVQ